MDGPLDTSLLEQLFAPVNKALDDEMARILGADHPFLDQLNQRVLNAVGKRLRPKLLLLMCKALGYEGKDALTYGACFELIHTATLVHDDVIDQADTRRGMRTLNADIGVTQTVLYGDLLYIRAHRAAASCGNLGVMVNIDKVSEKMIEGELLQNRVNFDASISEAQYFDILERKTAWLFGGTTKTAGLAAGLSEEACQALFDFGFHLGVSFQLVDDILDYTGAEEAMGKPVLSDLRGGKITLPLLRAVQKDPQLVEVITSFWNTPGAPLPSVLAVAPERSGGLAETRELAAEAARKAGEHLKQVPLTSLGEVLAALPDMLLKRLH